MVVWPYWTNVTDETGPIEYKLRWVFLRYCKCSLVSAKNYLGPRCTYVPVISRLQHDLAGDKNWELVPCSGCACCTYCFQQRPALGLRPLSGRRKSLSVILFTTKNFVASDTRVYSFRDDSVASLRHTESHCIMCPYEYYYESCKRCAQLG